MVVPRKHTTKGAQKQRRIHLRLKKSSFSFCPNCGSLKMSHLVCKNCGYYKEKEVINILKKELKHKNKKE